jgi:hypothetical protein
LPFWGFLAGKKLGKSLIKLWKPLHFLG